MNPPEPDKTNPYVKRESELPGQYRWQPRGTEPRHAGTINENDYTSRRGQVEDRGSQHDTNPHFNRKVTDPGDVTNPRGETNPYFVRPSQPPPEDPPPQPPRPGWLRPRDSLPLAGPPSDSSAPTYPQRRPSQHQDGSAEAGAEPPDQPRLRRIRIRILHSLAFLQKALAVTFCVFITLGGFAVLVIYLVFRPWSPRFGVSTATLNGVNFQKGYLVSLNLSAVVNFTNPNNKASVDLSYIVVELYLGSTIIAKQNVEPGLSAAKGGASSAEVMMVGSRVAILELETIKRQMVKNAVALQLKGIFLAQSKFWGVVRYSYWMHGQCNLVLRKPPHGVLVSSNCQTKHH